ncbi:MAG: anthranilate synthase component I family protein, partial [Chitinophagales bacterium]
MLSQKLFKAKTIHRQMLADTVTPVSIYLRLRDKYANSLLLESTDYHSKENSFSYICCQPIARFEVTGGQVRQELPDGSNQTNAANRETLVGLLDGFVNSFEHVESRFDFIDNGIFGYCNYDAVRYFEDLEIGTFEDDKRSIPDILYQVYQIVIAINHFKNELYIFEHQYDKNSPSQLEEVESIIKNQNIPYFGFNTHADEGVNLTDEEFLNIVQKGKDHCQ